MATARLAIARWRANIEGMTSSARLPDRAVLAVTGDDRIGYLQGLVSNDVAAAKPGRAVWAALLTPQGKWLADFFIHAEADRLLLDVEVAQSAMLMQKLTRFRLRAKVQIEPLPLLVHAGWDGPGPAGAVADPRLAQAGWRQLSVEAIETTSTPAEYDLHRLRLGLPDGSRDMESEKTTLLEAGFDELHGVSWTKGCYMGQELTARTKYRGLLKRRLVPVRIEGPQSAPGTGVFSGEAEVGSMRSHCQDWGLALLRNEVLEAPGLRCGSARLVPVRPDWMRASEPRLAGAPA